MKDFRYLQVWQKAHLLVLDIHRITAKFPQEERYALSSQLRRASTSIAANIAEGYGRDGAPEFHRFLQISAGSANEVDYELLLACDLGYLTKTQHAELSDKLLEVKRMLVALIRKVKAPRPDAAK